MSVLKTQEQGLITLSQQDYLPILVESFLIDRRSQGLSPDTIDLMVIAEDLLHFDWYQETLQKTYPSLVLPGPFPWTETMARANPLHAVCYVQYSTLTELECSGTLSPP